ERIFFLEALDQRAQRLIDDHRGVNGDLPFLPRAVEQPLLPIGATIHSRVVCGLRGDLSDTKGCNRAEHHQSRSDGARDPHAKFLPYLVPCSNSSLCCPRSGADVSTRGGVALSRTGLPTTETVPRLRCDRAFRMSSALTCGSANTSSMVLSGPDGTSSVSKA